ncbi:hypothetical protein B0H13DRAFT_2668162 [Mycena leptocephala]|nr:hypothetical protein B0H13DRAFT_2668162 [Mycena leptocephala]
MNTTKARNGMASTSRARKRPVRGDVQTGKDHFAAVRLDDQWILASSGTHFFQATRNGRRQRAKTLASSTLLTSLTLICPPTLLFTTSTSPSFSPPLLQREQGGLGGLGFHETPLAGLGRKGGGARAGSLVVLGFSKAAMRSHSKPGLG